MSAIDGHIVGTTKIVDHGSDKKRWNLAIIGDGYREDELEKYHVDVENFRKLFSNTLPIKDLYHGINIYRVDVVSAESGADYSGCGGGKPVTAKTYFDAKFCSEFSGAPLERLLTVNTNLALQVASAQVPKRHMVLCIVNSSKYGGAGGAVAVCSANESSSKIAIHEIGHTAFSLADEYGGNGAGTPIGEPAKPNVTRVTDKDKIKWHSWIFKSTPMPSACDTSGQPSDCVVPATPAKAGDVGTYEGGMYSNCNVYRPLPSCYMRDYGPFCPVCSTVIRETLMPFLPTRKLGPIGVARDKPFDDTTKGSRITQIVLHHGNYIDSMQVSYDTFRVPPRGGNRESKATVNIEKGDYIIRVSGSTFSPYGKVVVDTIEFETKNGHKFGPFGHGSHEGSQTPWTPFEFKAGKGEQIGGFFGSIGVSYPGQHTIVLASLGVSVIPLPKDA